jgi:hypothetical protein
VDIKLQDQRAPARLGLRCRLSPFEGKEGVEGKEMFNSAEEQYSEGDRAYRVA